MFFEFFWKFSWFNLHNRSDRDNHHKVFHIELAHRITYRLFTINSTAATIVHSDMKIKTCITLNTTKWNNDTVYLAGLLFFLTAYRLFTINSTAATCILSNQKIMAYRTFKYDETSISLAKLVRHCDRRRRHCFLHSDIFAFFPMKRINLHKINEGQHIIRYSHHTCCMRNSCSQFSSIPMMAKNCFFFFVLWRYLALVPSQISFLSEHKIIELGIVYKFNIFRCRQRYKFIYVEVVFIFSHFICGHIKQQSFTWKSIREYVVSIAQLVNLQTWQTWNG